MPISDFDLEPRQGAVRRREASLSSRQHVSASLSESARPEVRGCVCVYTTGFAMDTRHSAAAPRGQSLLSAAGKLPELGALAPEALTALEVLEGLDEASGTCGRFLQFH